MIIFIITMTDITVTNMTLQDAERLYELETKLQQVIIVSLFLCIIADELFYCYYTVI
jgi:hypothetical protein